MDDESVHAGWKREDSYTVENAMNALLSKLDEALDDVEHGRVLDEAELLAETDAI